MIFFQSFSIVKKMQTIGDSMKFLHLFVPDSKFVNSIVDMWETAYPGHNVFVVIKSTEHFFTDNDKIQILSESPACINRVRQLMQQCDMGFIHYASKYCLKNFVNNSDFIWVWCSWGGDYVYYSNKILTFETISLCIQTRPYLFKLISYFKEKIKSFRWYRKLKYRNVLSLWQQFKYVAPVLSCEYEFLQNDFPKMFNATVFEYTEGAFVDKNLRVDNSAKNIVVGNSAFPTNNHINVINMLKHLDLTGRKIFFPLSYGGTPIYKEQLQREIKNAFGESGIIIDKFMPPDDYFSLLKGCSIAFMPGIRQMAVGNIINLLAMGVKIYLSKKSPTYKFFKERDFFVYSIEDDFLSDAVALAQLSESQKYQNHQLILKYFSMDSVINKIYTMVDYIVKDNKYLQKKQDNKK